MIYRKTVLLAVALALLPLSGRTQAPATEKYRCTGSFATHEEAEEFLRNAPITKSKGLSVGVTGPQKLTLNDGKMEQFAVYKNVEERKRGITQLAASIEVDFKDSWKFEIAAYELDKLLGLHMVPVTVERRHRGAKGSLQLWIDDCMTEGERMKKNLSPPSPVSWRQQIFKLRVFDNLIYNIDRNLGNMLISPDWKIFMIDHSRSFKSLDDLRAPKDLTYFSRSLMESLKTLDEETVKQRCDDYLTPSEISTMIKRRDKILELYQENIDRMGPGAGYP